MRKRTTRIGAPPYLAARPCIEGFDADPRFELVLRSPAELIESLRSKELDVALVSSIEAFRRPGYRFAPSVGIVATREVRSVLLFTRRPLELCQSLALDPASRAGAALAQIILAERASARVQIVNVDTGSDPSSAGADCWVRIGDSALREAHALASAPSRGVNSLDLAQLWHSSTGLPFVFALWLARPGALLTPDLASALVAARDRGVARTRELAALAAPELGLPRELLHSYLADACEYTLDSRALAGLREFHRRAAALGLADPAIEPAEIGA